MYSSSPGVRVAGPLFSISGPLLQSRVEKVAGGRDSLCLRAITFETVKGVESVARPIRRNLEPGCITITFDPLFPGA